MIWISLRSWEYRKQAKECWHLWFAWRPVVIKEYPDGAVKKIWFQTVKRKGQREIIYTGYPFICEYVWIYEYKIIEEK